jgi:hypothetical protein
MYNHHDLRWQYDYRGRSLQNLRLLVCETCLDRPQPQLMPRILTPDPVPIRNPRLNTYAIGYTSTMFDYTVVPGTDVLRPVGLFVNDAAGAAFENSPAVASGKVTVMRAMASVEVDVYETRNLNDTADLLYNVGDLLYSSAQGFLTNLASNEAAPKTVIGIARNPEKLQRALKYGADFVISTQDKQIKDIRNEFREICKKNGLELVLAGRFLR